MEGGEEFAEFGDAFDVGFVGGFFVGVGGFFTGLGEAFVEAGEKGVEFAFLALAEDFVEHGPDVGFGDEEVAAVAGDGGAADDAPVDEVAEVHGDVAAGDLEFIHDLVGGDGGGGDHEEGMDLGHGAVDAPVLGHLAPEVERSRGGPGRGGWEWFRAWGGFRDGGMRRWRRS